MCHVDYKVAHRDLKPENLKLKGEEKDLVLYDFGVCKIFDGEEDLFEQTVGTYNFFAPEMMARPKDGGQKFMHSKRVDMWAAGVTLFVIAA